MLKSLIRFCVREPFVVLIAVVVIVAFGTWCAQTVPIDAIPNVGENQVIVLTAWPGRSPRDIEDQVTYPLSVRLLAVPKADSVRGRSMFGYSFVQVTFSDDTDLYWARSRVLEQLGTAAATLPEGVVPTLGPDATGLGQVFYYVLEPAEGMTLADVRSLQDFVVKFDLQAVEGVSEVASVGGYVRQYQIEVDPDKLRFHKVTLDQVVDAVRNSNIDVGAKTVESNGMEYIIRGRGFIGADEDVNDAVRDIEETVVRSRDGVPLRIRDLSQLQLGPDFRRGAIDLNGSEAVGGVVVMRFGENPREVIARVKEKIKQIEPSLRGVRFHAVYDRTGLIDETVGTLTEALQQELIITLVVIVLFLLHVRASFIVAITMPMSVLMTFIGMRLFGIDANIMSLAGIAIAIGEVADLGIIISENVYQHLAEWEKEDSPQQTREEVVINATNEVSSAVLTGVSTTIVSFLPIFFLTGRDYKLFAPLAWTKTFAMIAAILVALFLVPLLCRLLLRTAKWKFWLQWSSVAVAVIGSFVAVLILWNRGLSQHLPLNQWTSACIAAVLAGGLVWLLSREKLRPIEENPTSRLILFVYTPILRFFLKHKLAFVSLPAIIMIFGLGAWIGLPRVLQPVETACRWLGADLNEVPGYVDLKHTLPGLRTDDWLALDEGSWFYMPSLYPAASFTEAMQVLQTQDAMIKQIPEVENVLGKIGRAESALDPAPAAMIETYVMLKPTAQWRPGVTMQDVWSQINAVATLPGVTPASPLQPIEGRVVMLQSGIKAAMAIRIYGDSLEGLAEASLKVAEQLRKNPYVNAATVNPDIVMGKPYVEFHVDREASARFGMSTMMVNQIVESALGGMNLTTTVEGRERYPIRLRYQRDIRERIDQLDEIPVVTPTGDVVPMSQLARMETTWGPGMINSEDARLVAHVSFAPSGLAGDLETVSNVEQALRDAQSLDPDDAAALDLPAGYSLLPVGSFQSQIEANQRLLFIVPMVVLTNLLLIYLEFRNITVALIIFLQIPVAFAGGMIGLGVLGVEMNTAIWVGFIALFGISVDDGIVMATYLQQIFRRRKLERIEDIRDATVEAGQRRIRPCLMTAFTTFAALLPVMYATGRGADVAKAMALPVFSGMFFELISLFVVPVLFCWYMESRMNLGLADERWEAQTSPEGDSIVKGIPDGD